jgi:hypothetical protein
LFQLCCSTFSVVHGARLDMTEFMNWGGRVSCPTNSFFRVQLFIQGTNFLPNKQLFSSLKIRRCMISWMKCWARKSPAYVKNLGNIRSEICDVPGGKKSANFCIGAHLLPDRPSVKSYPTRPPFMKRGQRVMAMSLESVICSNCVAPHFLLCMEQGWT